MPSKGKGGAYAPLPSTLRRSPKKAQETYEKTLESAEKTYRGDESRAHRAAWAAVKHSFERTEDGWEPKKRKGPSDPRAEGSGPEPRGRSYGGIDVEGKRKDELAAEARRAGAHITTRMTKAEIADALEKAIHAGDRRRREGKRR
jgi:cation transport regulator ChaB